MAYRDVMIGPNHYRREKLPEPVLPRGPCAHLGEATGETVACGPCGPGRLLKVFTCAVHGRCVQAKRPEGIASCEGCLDHRPRPAATAVMLTGGIGDFFAAESFLSPEERERIETVYYACYCWREIRSLFARGMPNYPRLRDHVALPIGGRTYRSIEEVAEDHELYDAIDLSIGKVFKSGRAYSGSSFLLYTLAISAAPRPPYVVVVPRSDWGRYEGRDFTDADWAALLAFFEARELVGVILYNGKAPMPAHPRLLNLQGQLSLPESIETLKRADGYVGIDSCLSVLAAKLFPSHRLAVKGVSDHLWANLGRYYAPRKDFPFVARTLIPPTWEAP